MHFCCSFCLCYCYQLSGQLVNWLTGQVCWLGKLPAAAAVATQFISARTYHLSNRWAWIPFPLLFFSSFSRPLSLEAFAARIRAPFTCSIFYISLCAVSKKRILCHFRELDFTIFLFSSCSFALSLSPTNAASDFVCQFDFDFCMPTSNDS